MINTLMWSASWLTTSGTVAVTASIDMFVKNPMPKSFCPISIVYKAFEKSSFFGKKLLNLGSENFIHIL